MKHWILAFRLRTFPLAVSSILVGSAVLVLHACGATPNELEPSLNENLAKVQSVNHDTSSLIEPLVQGNGQLNFTDVKGRKQGHWITLLNNKPWKDEYFKDGLRDSVCKEYFANGDVYQVTYANGLRNGLCSQYDPDSTTAMFQSWYENDTSVYLVFPWGLAFYIVPVKGWHADKDSVEVNVKYLSGQPLYHGYLNRSSDTTLAVPYGEHRAYYNDGSLKATVNYDKDSMVLFNKKGQVIERTTPRKWRGRQLR
ncbi:MAG: hypothetical protein WAT61_11860 [Flavobacteriales bacterium]|jgi:antitoxin component YwqK of YwqJK toxin-antitoxin module